MAAVNRTAKNSVFIDVFEQPEYRLQMLQVLHPEMTDVTADDIQTITLKQVITNHQYNDLAFLVKDRLMVFVEAQSTWGSNLTVRILLYLADTIQQYILDHGMDIHGSRKLSLPKPEFYVIYTGERQVKEWISLRDDFFEDADCAIDLRARVFTAETEDIIGQYIIFCHIFDLQVRQYGRTEKAALETIRICRDRGVLKEYLRAREQEVISIMVMLFNQEYATQMFGQAQFQEGRKEGQKEGRREGRQEGRKEGRKEGRQEGENMLSALISKLLSSGRESDIARVVSEPEYRKQLYAEYGM